MNVYKIHRNVIYKCGDEEEFTIYSENMVVLVPNSLIASPARQGGQIIA